MKSNSHFHEPNAIKKQEPKCKPKDGKGIEWDYRSPQYDERSSNWVNAGTHYGVGINQPIGHEGNPKQRVACLPYGRIQTMDTDEVG
jgi:hypothetical protein